MTDLGDISTPALILDLDVLERNVARMQQLVSESGLQLRPHAKTHKSVHVAHRQLAAGASGITVGTLGEAEAFADGGVNDIFIAYPLIATGEKGRRLRSLHERINLRVGVDSEDAARLLANATSGTERPLQVLVECDCGERRSGVPATRAGEIAAAANHAGLEVVGAFTHGGHGYGPLTIRKEAATDEIDVLSVAAEQIRAVGLDPVVLSAGATPTVAFSSVAPVTEQRPGTYVFNDANQVAFGSCSDEDVAVTVLTTVVSDAAVPGQVIVDAGGKAIAREPSDLHQGYGKIPQLPGAVVHNVNDYHGFVQLSAGDQRPHIGDRVNLVPNHICPVVNLFARYFVVQQGKIVDEWRVDAQARSS